MQPVSFKSLPRPAEYYGDIEVPLIVEEDNELYDTLKCTVWFDMAPELRTWGVKNWNIRVEKVKFWNADFPDREYTATEKIEIIIDEVNNGEGLTVYDVDLHSDGRVVVNMEMGV